MDRDGTRAGLRPRADPRRGDAVTVPVIASGGVGTLQHLADGVTEGGADAVLAASIFHFGEFTVRAGQGVMACAASRSAGALMRPDPKFRPATGSTRSRFDERGLVPVIAQDALTQRMLMVAWMDRRGAGARPRVPGGGLLVALARAGCGARARSRATSRRCGRSALDCDGDVVLLSVEQVGGIACHTGRAAASSGVLAGRSLVDRPIRCCRIPSSIYRKSRATRTRCMSDADPQRLADVIESRRGADPDHVATSPACSPRARTPS